MGQVSLDTFYEDGYALFDTELGPELTDIRRQLILVFDEISVLNGLPPISDDEDINQLYRGDHRDLWVGAYDQLRNLPVVWELANHPIFINSIRSLGIKFPAMAAQIILRADMPDDDPWSFPPHQDYIYNLGSLNTITIWIPFQDITDDIGPLDIIPGSHRGGVAPHTDGLLREFDETKIVSAPMRHGQALAFSQFLYHRSGPNRSKRIRFSLQLRYNDLSSPEYARRKLFIKKTEEGEIADVSWETHYPKP